MWQREREKRGVDEQPKQTDEAFSTFLLLVQSGRKRERESSKSSGQATKIKKENNINRCSAEATNSSLKSIIFPGLVLVLLSDHQSLNGGRFGTRHKALVALYLCQSVQFQPQSV